VSYRTSILGSGNIGTALARRFAAKDMSLGIGNRQSPDKPAALVSELGETLVPQDVSDALRSDILILAIPFSSVPDATRDLTRTWSGKIVVDATYDTDAAAVVSDVILRLGFAPVSLGDPDQGGLLQQRSGVLFLAQLVAEDTSSSGSAQEPHLPGAEPMQA